MFDIGWSELIVVGVVALVVIGPKELPGVLRMIGQWMGKVRRMAAEFQGQFNEAMREAEMADLKKSFDEIKETASTFSKDNLLTSLSKDVDDALKIDDAAAASSTPTSPEPPTASTPAEAEAHAVETRAAESHAQEVSAAAEPLAITSEAQAAAEGQGEGQSAGQVSRADLPPPQPPASGPAGSDAAETDPQKGVKAS